MITNFSVPQPCGEEWDKMLPGEKGRYCASCQKVVQDFTHMSKQQILDYLEQQVGKKTCGTFRKSQLYNPSIIKESDEKRVRFLAAVLLVFGLSLFSCNPDPDSPEGIPNENKNLGLKVLGTIRKNLPQLKNGESCVEETNATSLCSTTTGIIVPEVVIPDPIPEEPILDETRGTIHIEKVDSTEVLLFADKMPEFPGGTAAFLRYISGSILYPPLALDMAISGTVYISFVVETDGSIKDVRLLRGIGFGCDEEALRVIRNMPNWYPASNNGKTVRVRYNVPIRFRLQ